MEHIDRHRSTTIVVAGILVVAAVVGVLVTADARATVLGDPRPSFAAVRPSADATLASGEHGVRPAAFPAAREPVRFLLVEVVGAMPITSRPGGGRVVGTMPAGSRFYGEPTVAWVRAMSDDGRFGLVDVPYVATRVSGWIRLRGLESSSTRISVVADLSERRIEVRRGRQVLFRAPVAVGTPVSPTPAGRYFVTDRVPFPGGGVLGTFAFGISGIQPNLPPGWTGGDQLAIHGTNAPSTIGTPASAGCLRTSEQVLDRLLPLLRLGTPVIVHP
ncbi:MAG: L,D-transpeptidase [Actinomycetota bacterium]